MRGPVSAVVPSYNYGRFVKEALDSIIPQLQNNDELLVIDDASDDDSAVIILDRLRGVANARLIRHDRNQGVLAVLNEGLSLATREYVCFPGADDRVGAGVFDAALRLLAENPSAGLCSGMVKIIDETGEPIGSFPMRILLSQPGYLPPEQVRRALIQDDSWISGLAFYRTDRLRAVGGFRADLSSFADGFACRVVAARHGCCFVPITFQYWRRMAGGLSWDETANLGHVEEIGRRAVELMRGPFAADFPPDYPARWLGRWRFGAFHFAQQNRQRERWKPVLAWTERHARALRPAVTTAMALARVPGSVALLLKHRSSDGASIIRRRLGHLFRQDV